MAGRLLLGTSGFAYPEWRGAFYPPDVRADAMLGAYAARFASVEINYTFQRNPSAKTIAKWTADTPEGFAFSLKAHRRITHERRLAGAEEPLRLFLDALAPLGERTGAVLFQCPPTLRADPGLLDAFLALLPEGRRFAFEFRHDSWDTGAVREALARRGAAWCAADTDTSEATLDRATPAFAYVRLRRSAYDDEALARWAKAIGEALADGTDVYCYFKHEDGDGARGAGYARALRDMLGDDGGAR